MRVKPKLWRCQLLELRQLIRERLCHYGFHAPEAPENGTSRLGEPNSAARSLFLEITTGSPK
ncbi:MAG: hypothetical protein L0H15_12280 [Nitrosospira sp.]|nr:hypothetical protein [Nitrosospira sp.]